MRARRAPGLQRLGAGWGVSGHPIQQGWSWQRAPVVQVAWRFSGLTPHPYRFRSETLSAPYSWDMQNVILLSSSMCTGLLHPRQWNLQPQYCPLLISHQYQPLHFWPALCHPSNTRTPSDTGVDMLVLSLVSAQALNRDPSRLYSQLSFLTTQKLPLKRACLLPALLPGLPGQSWIAFRSLLLRGCG